MGLRSMFSGISGLQSTSTLLDVIGNNVSNVNTVAYKASRVTFSDAISQTLSSGSGPSTSSNLGGVNGNQIGLGTRVQSIQTLFTAGPTLQTGNATDIALQGDGFLVAKSGSNSYLTRAGNLTFDGSGNLVDANGSLIQGFTANTTYTTRVLTNDGGNILNITDASLKLNTSNTSAIGNIQIKSDMTLPPKATSVMNFSGNLDSNAPAWNNGDLGVVGAENLPLAENGVIFNAAVANPALVAGKIDQTTDMANASNPIPPGPNAQGLVANPVRLDVAQANNNYAWNQPQTAANQPSATVVQTVYDSLGNPHEITTLFYQVEDMSQTGPNPSPGPSQAAYAWYSFDTTGGKTPYTGAPTATQSENLLGGSGLAEGFDQNGTAPFNYNRGNITGNNQYYGDVLYFNTDGSLANTGGLVGTAAAAQFAPPVIYLAPDQPAGLAASVSPIPTVGAEVMAINMNFGTAGQLGTGKRDGLYSDAAGSFQTINGVNTYQPNDTAFVKTQDGHAEGQLTGLSFDHTGTIQGSFSTGSSTMTVALGQIVMAKVDNPEGLTKLGNGYYQTSANSGSTFVGLAGQNGLGTVQGDALEGSNVDLTVELSNMIIAQRGFDVNARTISTANDTLTTLVNLGR